MIQGASFDGSRLSHVTGDAPTSRSVPPMGLAWLPKSQSLPYQAYLTAPLYATGERAKVLAEVQVPLASGGQDEDAAAFTLAGLALFLGA